MRSIPDSSDRKFGEVPFWQQSVFDLKHRHGKKLRLSVEMVRGMTTCLFSKRAFKMLHGSLDSQADQCVLSRVQSGPILLQTSPTGLYLINLLDIYQKDEIAFSHEEPHTCLSKSSQTQLRDGGSVGDLSELSKNKKIWGSVVGVSQLMQDSPVQSKKFMRARDFRSKAPVAQFPKSSSVG